MAENVGPALKLEHRAEVIQALQNWSSNQPAAIDALRPAADAGDAGAIALLAWMFSQAGRWTEGVEYARKSAELDIEIPLNNYVGNMINDPTYRRDAVGFARALRDAAWPLDPFSYAIAAVQQGDPDTAVELVELALLPAPSGARQQWEGLVADVQPAVETIKGTVALAEAERERSVAAIQAHEEHVESERERMQNLVAEVTSLAHEGASLHLAKEYSKQAEQVEKSATSYTKASLIIGAIAAGASGVIAFFAFTQEDGVGGILTKAALALPILAFAAYVGRLAAIHRKQAWRWRHIELQIRTANPFVSPLSDEQRKLLIAALALRFFPGQGAARDENTEGQLSDPVAVLAEMIRPGASSPPGDSQTAPASGPPASPTSGTG